MTKSLENIIAMIIAVCLLLLLPVFISEMHYSRCLTVTGQASVQELASQISKERELTVYTYNQHADELYKCGYDGELQISYYTYESVADGVAGVESGKRKYVVTWEEIKEEMLLSEKYEFPDHAYVCVTAKAHRTGPTGLKMFLQTKTDYSESAYIERGKAK